MGNFTRWFIIAALFLVPAIVIVLGYWLKWDWTGFKGKTLWDWLNLLGVLAIPAVVGFGTVWFTTQQGKVSNEENIDNQREAALQAYIDAISELLLDKGLLTPKQDNKVQDVARVRTLTVLRKLDGDRKGAVLRFLHEAAIISIISKDASNELSRPDFSNANLEKVYFVGINLFGANLREANFAEANLCNATLIESDLRQANLRKANLDGADLRFAKLNGADLTYTSLNGANLANTEITDEQMKQAKSIKGAIMPDGSKHP